MNDSLNHEKIYRTLISKDYLKTYEVKVSETDLWIRTDSDLSEIAFASTVKLRNYIEEYIRYHPSFLRALTPLELDPKAPEIVKDMLLAGRKARVGPMAAVAGAISEHVGRDLANHSPNVIVENGGDLYLRVQSRVRVGVYAAGSPLSMKIAIVVDPEETPIGVCTSSASVGHSLSFGVADAVCVTSPSSALADAAATWIGNRIRGKGDIKRILKSGMEIEGVRGILVISGEQLGLCGKIEIDRI